MKLNKSKFLVILVMASMPFCASLGLAQSVEQDPWEGFNRKVFVFNENVDRYFLRPIATGYKWVMPAPLDKGVSNIFNNLGEVGNFANNLLQGKVGAASGDAARLLINSTAGIGGTFDVATRMGLQRSEEDFGQTLGVWRLGSGPYLVLPFLGPSTLRDTVAKAPEVYLSPLYYLEDDSARIALAALDAVDVRADLLQSEELIQGDRYSFIRDVYLQRRAFLLSDGEVEDEFTSDDLDDY